MQETADIANMSIPKSTVSTENPSKFPRLIITQTSINLRKL